MQQEVVCGNSRPNTPEQKHSPEDYLREGMFYDAFSCLFEPFTQNPVSEKDRLLLSKQPHKLFNAAIRLVNLLRYFILKREKPFNFQTTMIKEGFSWRLETTNFTEKKEGETPGVPPQQIKRVPSFHMGDKGIVKISYRQNDETGETIAVGLSDIGNLLLRRFSDSADPDHGLFCYESTFTPTEATT